MTDPKSAFARETEQVHATLESAWRTAQAIFGERATPEVALAIYDRIVSAKVAPASGSGGGEISMGEFEMGGFRVD